MGTSYTPCIDVLPSQLAEASCRNGRSCVLIIAGCSLDTMCTDSLSRVVQPCHADDERTGIGSWSSCHPSTQGVRDWCAKHTALVVSHVTTDGILYGSSSRFQSVHRLHGTVERLWTTNRCTSCPKSSTTRCSVTFRGLLIALAHGEGHSIGTKCLVCLFVRFS